MRVGADDEEAAAGLPREAGTGGDEASNTCLLGSVASLLYVKGIGNMADFETAAGGAGQAACISKGFVAELKTKTIAQVIAEVDKFYKENPAKLDLPVVAVILQRCTKLCAPTAEKK